MSEHEHNWVKSFLESLESMKIEEIFHENASQDLTNKSLVYVRGIRTIILVNRLTKKLKNHQKTLYLKVQRVLALCEFH